MYKHILLPTDGSELSARAIDAGVGLAKSLGARLTALNVTPPYYPEGGNPSTFVQQSRAHAERSEATARQALDYPARKASEAGVPCAPLHRVADAPWQEIIKAAGDQGCDLILMASHGRRGVAALLLGSETHKVLTHSKTPVLVVR